MVISRWRQAEHCLFVCVQADFLSRAVESAENCLSAAVAPEPAAEKGRMV